jgi:peptidyl-prolyl cis-trans isomerase SurA
MRTLSNFRIFPVFKISLLLFVLGLLNMPAWKGQSFAATQMVDRIVAVVNDEAICLQDFMEYYKPYREKLETMGYPPEKMKPLEEKLRKEKLDQMIDERLAQQQIKKMNLKVSETEINGAIEQVRKMNGYSEEDFEKALETEHLTMDDYKGRVKEQILRARLINQEVKSRIVVTESDIKEYYKGHLDEFKENDSVHLRNIVIPVSDSSDDTQKTSARDRILEVYTKLKAGASFEALAKEYTVASLSASGGDLGWFEKAALSNQIRGAIENLEPGGYTQILDTDKGFQIFQVQEVRQQSAKSLDSVSDQIQKKLYDGIVEEKFKAWIKELRNQAYIKRLD